MIVFYELKTVSDIVTKEIEIENQVYQGKLQKGIYTVGALANVDFMVMELISCKIQNFKMKKNITFFHLKKF